MSQMPGAYSSPMGPATIAPAPKKSNVILWVFLGIGGLMLCGCGGCIAMGVITAVMVGPPAVAAAMESQSATVDPRVVEKIGTITAPPQQVPGGEKMEMGKLMEMSWQLNGSKGSATHTVRVEKQGDSWKVTSSRVKFSDGTEVDLKSAPATNQVMPVDPSGTEPDATESDADEADETDSK